MVQSSPPQLTPHTTHFKLNVAGVKGQTLADFAHITAQTLYIILCLVFSLMAVITTTSMSIVYATALALSLFFHMVLSPVASAFLATCHTAYIHFQTCHSSHPPLDPLLHLPRTLLTFVYSCILPTSSQHSHTTTCTSTPTTLSTSPTTCTFYLSAHLSSTHNTSTPPVSMLIDTGAAVTLINKQFLQTLSLQDTHLSPPPASTKLVSATGSTIDILGSLELSVTLPHNVVLPLSTLVVSDITESFILGVDSLQAHSVTLSFCTPPTFSVHDHTYTLTNHASTSTCMSHAHPSASINDTPTAYHNHHLHIHHIHLRHHPIVLQLPTNLHGLTFLVPLRTKFPLLLCSASFLKSLHNTTRTLAPQTSSHMTSHSLNLHRYDKLLVAFLPLSLPLLKLSSMTCLHTTLLNPALLHMPAQLS